MFARILQPTKSAMQSGKAKKSWKIEILPEKDFISIDNIAGWHSASDTSYQIKLQFDSLDEAREYAKRYKLEYEVVEPKKRKLIKKSYASNFN